MEEVGFRPDVQVRLDCLTGRLCIRGGRKRQAY